MPAYVIDTDVAVDILCGDTQAVSFFERLQGDEDTHIFVSEITRSELLSISGLTDENEEQIERLIECFDEVIQVDEVISKQAARLRRFGASPRVLCGACGKRSGGRLKTPDSIVAATALTEQATLVTRNSRDYEHLTEEFELALLNPRSVPEGWFTASAWEKGD